MGNLPEFFHVVWEADLLIFQHCSVALRYLSRYLLRNCTMLSSSDDGALVTMMTRIGLIGWYYIDLIVLDWIDLVVS